MVHTVLNGLQRFAERCDAHDKVAAQAPFRRECREKSKLTTTVSTLPIIGGKLL